MSPADAKEDLKTLTAMVKSIKLDRNRKGKHRTTLVGPWGKDIPEAILAEGCEANKSNTVCIEKYSSSVISLFSDFFFFVIALVFFMNCQSPPFLNVWTGLKCVDVPSNCVEDSDFGVQLYNTCLLHRVFLSISHRKIVSKRRTTINHRGWIQNMASNSIIQASSSGSVSAMSDTAVRAPPASLACEQSIQTVIEVASSAHAAFATHVETIIKTIHLMTRAEAAPSLVPATTANALVGLPTIHVSPPLHTIGSYPESRKTNRINGPLVWIICFIMAGLIVIGVLI